MKTIAFFLLLFTANCSFSQVISYNDVAVIVNDNSQASIDIGNYFQQARSIPSQNMIHVLAPTTEVIDSLQFEQIRSQIENYLINNNLVDSFNYLVTTKGIPLEVMSNVENPDPNAIVSSSFDSELTLILSANSNVIGLNGSWQNPIYGSTQNFSRANSGIYLVTRLDGFNVQDVYNLIDRSGPSTGINKSSAQAIVDLDASNPADSGYFMDYYLAPVHDYLLNNAWNVQLDLNVGTLVNQTNVFAYFFEGYGPIGTPTLNYSWTEGSIASLATCETANSFDPTINQGSLVLGDLIAEGCTGAHGNINCIYFSQILNGETVINRYLDPVLNFNLAESFYMGESRLSWQAVVVGDPKSSAARDDLATINDIEKGKISIYPNPSGGSVHIVGDDVIRSIVVFDMKGTQVAVYDQLMSNSVELDLQHLGDGIYFIEVAVDEQVIRSRMVIRN